MTSVTSTNYTSQIWAGIIIFNPNLDKLNKLVSALTTQVHTIAVYNNGGIASDTLSELFKSTNHTILGSGENVGIAQAVNAICTCAQNNGAEYVITFDQDSSPDTDLVFLLHSFFQSLSDQRQVAAVAPYFVDRRNRKALFPILQESRWWVRKAYPAPASNGAIQTTLLITSGMLLKLSAWKKIGPFRDDYFIDHVDTEWCLRAHRLGFKLYIHPGLIMEHELSDEPPKRVFGRLVLKYSPIRRYYVFRNSVTLILDKNVPRGNRLYLLATIGYRFFVNLLVDDNKLRSLKAMALGVTNGLTGKMGRFDGNL